MPRTVVKVCGLTRAADARVALDAGADWLGFVLNGDGPRRVSPETVAAIAADLHPATIVGVMVSPDPEEAMRLARAAGAHRVQLHRVDPWRWPEDFALPACFAVPVASDGAITEPLPSDRHLVLLDAAHPSLAGGTGTTFPWETARVVAATRPVLMAGGLDGANVGLAIETVRPFGVDASSRLESAPGIKDAVRVRAYVAAARACDASFDD